MTQNKPLLRGVSLAILALASAGAGTASAQTQPSAPAAAANDTSEAVVVTGTRLRGVAPVGSPIQSINAEDLKNTSETSTARIIQELPQVLDLGISEGSRAQNGGSGNIVYGTGINLRGLGPYATLVLIDGHRAVDNQRALDPSVMPALGLSRIDILTDGASALYGSDAVAGVINLIPTRFKDETQVYARYGFGDAFEENTAGFAFGRTWRGGQIHLAFENARRSALHGHDRDFFRQNQVAEGGLDYRINQCDPGNIVIGATSYAIPAGGVTPANNSALIAGTQNLCEGSTHQDLLPEQTYNDISFTFNQKLTPSIEFVADGFYSEREFYRAVAISTANLTVPNTNAFYTAPVGPPPASETVRYKFSELPSNDTFGHARNYEMTAGLNFDLPADWRLETLVTYGQGRDLSSSYHGINNTALNAALASSNPATAFDPYGLHRTDPAVLAGIANQIFIAPTNNEFTGFEARLDGALFTLPGGAVRLATGYERQDLDYHTATARGNPGTALVFRNFNRTVDSAYMELLVPLVGDDNAMPGIRELQINLAGRYDNYSDVGSTTNPKIGINWKPADDFLVRGSYGTSLRAPSFAELYGNSSNLFTQTYTDPTIPGNRQGVALSGGNLNLKPEKATTYTVGFDVTPHQFSGARLGLTYFHIEYNGQITTYLSNLNVLSLESQLAGTGVITRGAAAATAVANLLASGITYATPPATNPITLFVDGRTLNLGRSLMEGIDFEGSYSWDLDRGRLTAAVNGAFLNKYNVAVSPGGPLIDHLDTIFNPHDFDARGTLTWDANGYRVSTAINYIGGYKNDLLATPQKVDAWVTADANLTFDIGDPSAHGFTLGIDARNLFDQDPPYVNVAPNANGSGGFDATTANPTGRVLGVSVRKSF